MLTFLFVQLAMLTLGTMFGGTYLAMSGPKKATTPTPPINASSSDEEDFIKCDPPRHPNSHTSHTRRLTILQEVHGERRSGREEGEAVRM